jgi:phage terminase small subunit
MPVLSNAKHELFAQEVAKGTPLEKAYALAGYKPDPKNAARLTKNDAVRTRIDELLTLAAEKAGVTIQSVMSELAKIGFSDIRRAVKWGHGIAVEGDGGEVRIANGVSLIASDEIDDDTAAAISEVTQTKEGLKVKFHDKRAALVDLGRHLGMFKDKTESAVTITVNNARDTVSRKLSRIAATSGAGSMAGEFDA